MCVLNHRGDLDWMIGWVLIERMGMLGVSFTLARLIMFVLICHVRTFSTTVLYILPQQITPMPLSQQTDSILIVYMASEKSGQF